MNPKNFPMLQPFLCEILRSTDAQIIRNSLTRNYRCCAREASCSRVRAARCRDATRRSRLRSSHDTPRVAPRPCAGAPIDPMTDAPARSLLRRRSPLSVRPLAAPGVVMNHQWRPGGEDTLVRRNMPTGPGRPSVTRPPTRRRPGASSAWARPWGRRPRRAARSSRGSGRRWSGSR